ncbi:hypothetical protein, partial [Sansalvadorimonas verongulae]|uniref:hypothetical protein n=1 Tax=Sansalvadorimonas verongulae TaxID=2172824 RepID=UPI001E59752B
NFSIVISPSKMQASHSRYSRSYTRLPAEVDEVTQSVPKMLQEFQSFHLSTPLPSGLPGKKEP